jgi:tripartite-type tricarboxylate transporter receptor subunit TctC
MVPFLLGGKIDFAWSGGIHNRYGDKMKVLISMNPGRLIASPDIPSVQEGYGISMPSQAVIVVPSGTPINVVKKLEKAISDATKDKDFSDLVTNKLKFPVKFVGSEQLTKEIDKTAKALKKVIKGTM